MYYTISFINSWSHKAKTHPVSGSTTTEGLTGAILGFLPIIIYNIRKMIREEIMPG